MTARCTSQILNGRCEEGKRHTCEHESPLGSCAEEWFDCHLLVVVKQTETHEEVGEVWGKRAEVVKRKRVSRWGIWKGRVETTQRLWQAVEDGWIDPAHETCAGPKTANPATSMLITPFT